MAKHDRRGTRTRRAGSTPREPPYHISFFGRLHPAGNHITIHNPPEIKYNSRDLGYDVTIAVHIADSHVRIDCILDQWREELLHDIYIRASDVARAIVDLAAFKEGWGIVLSIDRWRDPSDRMRDLALADPRLVNLATVFQVPGAYGALVKLIIENPPIFLLLNDLVIANTFAHHAVITCARAVEGVRQLIAGPGMEAKKAWPIMHAALNTTPEYVSLITDNSKDHRHGNRVVVTANTLQIITSRSWTIVDRFLTMKLRGLSSLPLTDFPILTA